MGFFVDKVSEDSFYENLLVGLPKILEKLPNVHDKKLKRNPPTTKLQVKNWENIYGVKLPQDLHDLYLSCDGLLYTYIFSYEPANREEINKAYGKIEVNPIRDLGLIDDYDITNVSRIYHDGYIYKLDLSIESKVFEISDNENYKVVLVYVDRKTPPTIWIYAGKVFYFIANDLTTYLKMAIAHLGVPCWHFVFTPLGLPGRSREMLNIIAPGILFEDRALVKTDEESFEMNVLETDIFEKLMHIQEKIEPPSPLLKKTSASTIGCQSSGVTLARKSSGTTIGGRTSSIVSSNSEKLKRRFPSRRRPFTPRF